MAYIVGHPIRRPQDFFGRQEEVARFYEILGGPQAQSVSILGLRRAGKTSFLHYVSRPEVMARYLPDPEGYTMVTMDMSACKSPADFYQQLLARLRRALGEGEPVNLGPESPAGAATMYDVETLLGHYPQQRVVLLLDEFDQLRRESFDQDFLIELRAMMGLLEYDLACVTASYWDLYYLGNQVGLPPTSPFYNIFYPRPIYLAGLETAAVEALVATPAGRVGVVFTAAEMANISHLAGSLPFFLQATAAAWLEQRRAGHSPAPALALGQLAADLSPYFEQWWRNFDDGYRELLRCLAGQVALERLPYSPFEIEAALRRLRRYGLVAGPEAEPAINGAIFSTWLSEFSQLAPNQQKDAPASPQAIDPAGLRQVLIDTFSLEELRSLCFDLDVDFEELPGSSKGAKARELIDYCRNRRDLNRLLEAVRQQRGAIV